MTMDYYYCIKSYKNDKLLIIIIQEIINTKYRLNKGKLNLKIYQEFYSKR